MFSQAKHSFRCIDFEKKKKQIVKTNLDENGKIQQYNYDDNIFYTTGTIRLSYYSIFVVYVH